MDAIANGAMSPGSHRDINGEQQYRVVMSRITLLAASSSPNVREYHHAAADRGRTRLKSGASPLSGASVNDE
ncbi:MAG: hypothetical protein U0670_05210 [Anaerolineae bacterium]